MTASVAMFFIAIWTCAHPHLFAQNIACHCDEEDDASPRSAVELVARNGGHTTTRCASLALRLIARAPLDDRSSRGGVTAHLQARRVGREHLRREHQRHLAARRLADADRPLREAHERLDMARAAVALV